MCIKNEILSTFFTGRQAAKTVQFWTFMQRFKNQKSAKKADKTALFL
jgi:hypothetical protein